MIKIWGYFEMRIGRWNSKAGGGRRGTHGLGSLKTHEPDVVAFAEFRSNAAEHGVCEGLRRVGLANECGVHSNASINMVLPMRGAVERLVDNAVAVVKSSEGLQRQKIAA